MIKGQLLKVTNLLNLLALNFPDSHPIFRKTSVDFGDNVEFCPSFRKQNSPAPRKGSGRTEKFWSRISSRSRCLAGNSNQGSSTNKKSQRSHYVSPYVQVHGSWLGFCRVLIGSRIIWDDICCISSPTNHKCDVHQTEDPTRISLILPTYTYNSSKGYKRS